MLLAYHDEQDHIIYTASNLSYNDEQAIKEGVSFFMGSIQDNLNACITPRHIKVYDTLPRFSEKCVDVKHHRDFMSVYYFGEKKGDPLYRAVLRKASRTYIFEFFSPDYEWEFNSRPE